MSEATPGSILKQLSEVYGNDAETDFSYESNERISSNQRRLEELLKYKSPEVVEKFLKEFDLFLTKSCIGENQKSFNYNKDGIAITIPIIK